MKMIFLIILLFSSLPSLVNAQKAHADILPDGQYGIGDYNVLFINRVTVEDSNGKSYFTNQIIEENGIFRTKEDNRILSGKIFIDRFDENSKPIGELKNGKRSGEWKIFFEGLAIWSGAYKNGKLHGKIISWWEKPWIDNWNRTSVIKGIPYGLMRWEISFKDGKLDGKYIRYTFPYHNKEIDGNYKNGKKDGLFKNLNGSNGTFKDDEKEGLWKDVYGDEKSVGTYTKGKKKGLWTYFHKNGEVKEKGEYDHNLKTGVWTKWNEKNTKIEEGAYEINDSLKKEDKIGVWLYWDKNGKIRKEEKWEEGKVKDISEIKEEWHDSSKRWKKARGKMINGEKEGLWEYWRGDGFLSKIETYKNGKKHGVFIDYSYFNNYSSGKSKVEFYYENGTLIKKVRYFESYTKNHMKAGQGPKEYEVSYKNKQPFGIYKSWYKSGSLREYGQYAGYDSKKESIKKGEWLYFSKKGELIDKKTFKNGKRRWLYDRLNNKNKYKTTYSWHDNSSSIKEIVKIKEENDSNTLIEKIYFSKKGDTLYHFKPLENLLIENFDLRSIGYHSNGNISFSKEYFGLDTNELITSTYNENGKIKQKKISFPYHHVRNLKAFNGKKIEWNYSYHKNGKLKNEICYELKTFTDDVKSYEKQYFDNGQIAIYTQFYSGGVEWTDKWNEDGSFELPIQKGMNMSLVKQFYREPYETGSRVIKNVSENNNGESITEYVTKSEYWKYYFKHPNNYFWEKVKKESLETIKKQLIADGRYDKTETGEFAHHFNFYIYNAQKMYNEKKKQLNLKPIFKIEFNGEGEVINYEYNEENFHFNSQKLNTD